MSKLKKIIIATVVGVITLGGLIACTGPGHYENNAKRSEFIAKRLDLNEDQKQKLDALMATIKTERQEYKGHLKQEITTLLAESELNQKAAFVMLEQYTNKILESAPTVIASIAEFTNSLNDEQRAQVQKFMAKARSHGRHSGGHIF